MKAYLPLILILLVIIGLIVWVFINDNPPEIKHHKFTIGTITEFKQGQKSSGLDAIIIFYVKEKKYEGRIKSKANSSNVIGEKYEVVYEEKNPEIFIVLRYKPLFTNEELNLVKETQCIITKGIHKYNFSSNKYISNYGIEFEYEVNGKKFTKSQSLPKDFKEKYPSLQEGDIYNVRYWQQNPKRAIIYLDKSINKR